MAISDYAVSAKVSSYENRRDNFMPRFRGIEGTKRIDDGSVSQK